MSSSHKCLCMSFRSCWAIILILNFLLIGAMIATIFIEKWVTINIYKSTDLDAGLLKYNENGESTYEESTDDVCDRYEQSKEDYKNGDITEYSLNRINSFCKMFKGLELAGKVYLYLESAAAFFGLIWIFIMIIYCKRRSGLCCAYFFAFSCLAAHAAGFVFYILKSNTSFWSCGEMPTDGSQPKMCFSYGAYLSLALGATLVLNVFNFVLTSRKVKKNKGFMKVNEGVQDEENSRIEDSRISGNGKTGEGNYSKVQNISITMGYGERNSNRKD